MDVTAYEHHSALYHRYEDARLLQKYKTYAKWTIASVFPEADFKTDLRGNNMLERDYQSMGAILVNNLTAKLVKLLFPVGLSFFRIEESRELQEQLREITQGQKINIPELQNLACNALLRNAGYAQLHQLVKTLIVTGNALIVRRGQKLSVYSPKNFVVFRDQDGTVMDCILKESMAFGGAPAVVKSLQRLSGKQPYDTVDLYTRIRRLDDGRYEVSQEIQEIAIGEPIVYAHNLCPYIPVVWGLVNGDSYGHGIVQDYAGDFAKLSMLSEALSKYQVDACKVVNLVKAGAGGDIDALATAQCGQWVQADPDAVGKTQPGNVQIIAQILQDLNQIIQRLSIAFMYTSNVRDAQRVTAEEIRQKVNEADQALGGVYSQLSEGLHKPLAYLLLAEISQPMGILIMANKVQVRILTGTAALGRSNNTERLLQATQVLGVLIPALTQVSRRFNTQKIVDQTLLNYGVILDDVLKSEAQLRKEAQMQQQQMQALQMAQAGAQNAQNIGNMMQGF